MENKVKKNIATRKIQIRVNLPEGEEKNKCYSTLRFWAKQCIKASNFIVAQQHINFNIKSRIRLYNPDINIKYEVLEAELVELSQQWIEANDEKKEEINKRRKEIYGLIKELNDSLKDFEKDFYLKSGTSSKGDNPPVQNSTAQLVTKKFSFLPSYIVAALNQIIYKSFKEDYKEVLKGKKSVRTYKNEVIHFLSSAIRNLKLNYDNGEYEFELFKIPFSTILGKDRSSNHLILSKIVSGEYKLKGSMIKIIDKEFYLFITFESPFLKNKKLSKDIAVGVDIGVKIPLFITSTNDVNGWMIGSKKALSDRKASFSNQRTALQIALAHGNATGHGMKRKLKRMAKLKYGESNYTSTLLHTYSKKVIDYAIQQGAGIIKMELLSGITEQESNLKYLKRNWPVRKLQTLIEQKAKNIGIEVVYIDPYLTSQTCSKCGHYQEGQRLERAEFKCKNKKCSKFNLVQHADRNASINICNSKKVVTKKEDCEVEKIKKRNKEKNIAEFIE